MVADIVADLVSSKGSCKKRYINLFLLAWSWTYWLTWR